jgi:hypothetical protein
MYCAVTSTAMYRDVTATRTAMYRDVDRDVPLGYRDVHGGGFL